jgi:hypothetical protein
MSQAPSIRRIYSNIYTLSLSLRHLKTVQIIQQDEHVSMQEHREHQLHIVTLSWQIMTRPTHVSGLCKGRFLPICTTQRQQPQDAKIVA